MCTRVPLIIVAYTTKRPVCQGSAVITGCYPRLRSRRRPAKQRPVGIDKISATGVPSLAARSAICAPIPRPPPVTTSASGFIRGCPTATTFDCGDDLSRFHPCLRSRGPSQLSAPGLGQRIGGHRLIKRLVGLVPLIDSSPPVRLATVPVIPLACT